VADCRIGPRRIILHNAGGLCNEAIFVNSETCDFGIECLEAEFRVWPLRQLGLTCGPGTPRGVFHSFLSPYRRNQPGDDPNAYSAEVLRDFVLDRASPHGITAKIVLTSTDPEYESKLAAIKAILSDLKPDEALVSTAPRRR
jgi:hypothetical protein